mgnify:CR=1 FL=1
MMSYTKEMFKNEVSQFCSKKYDPVAVAKKVTSLFNQYQADISLELRDVMLDIMTMEDGAEFEMTREEFMEFLEKI